MILQRAQNPIESEEFVILCGFIGLAPYILKLTTAYTRNNDFKDENIPDHIARLFIGTAVAIIVYLVLSRGGFLG